MSVPVWTFNVNYPVRRARKKNQARVDLGPGFTKTVIKDPSKNRADGKGTLSSYRGVNVFQVVVRKKHLSVSGTKLKDILDFLQKRYDNGNEAFYFYHPSELATPDATGVNTTGRYKVQHLGDIEDVLTHFETHDFAVLVFEETFL